MWWCPSCKRECAGGVCCRANLARFDPLNPDLLDLEGVGVKRDKIKRVGVKRDKIKRVGVKRVGKKGFKGLCLNVQGRICPSLANIRQ